MLKTSTGLTVNTYMDIMIKILERSDRRIVVRENIIRSLEKQRDAEGTSREEKERLNEQIDHHADKIDSFILQDIFIVGVSGLAVLGFLVWRYEKEKSPC
jgi:hypothetical protein